MKQVSFLVTLLLLYAFATAQPRKGRVVDEATNEPLQGATIKTGNTIILSAADGSFTVPAGITAIEVSFAGYATRAVIPGQSFLVFLKRNSNDLDEVVLSANRSVQQRREAPLAIATIGKQLLEETKATQLDQLLNKVSGVNMVDLGNEQHQMSIRQPMTTKSLFLYLEDGIPVRTTGLYNHNALLEMNMTAARQIEIIKGPASSLYGAEAIGGVVNIITQGPSVYLNAMAGVQMNNTGYKRADIQAGDTYGKFGWLVSGYYASRSNGPVDHSDFHKAAVTVRGDYAISEKTKWVNDLTYVDYYSDMLGTLDSSHFARKDYSTPQTFTYRKVPALRVKSQLFHEWNGRSRSQVSVVYRDNAVKQNPSYRVKNDLADPALAHGEINQSSFHTYMAILQHQQQFRFLDSKLTAGISFDGSPSSYVSNYIRIQRDTRGYYLSYTSTDSALSRYRTKIRNMASYAQYQASLVKGLKLTAALRYDDYQYNFVNTLPPSAFTGAPSSRNVFRRFSPKVGLTYNLKNTGIYGNYSEGFVPPQISDLFTGVKVPYLGPQTFSNYETGGWFSFVKHKLYIDWSAYLLVGTNEIITVKNPDNSTENRNAGKTRHTGIEYGLHYKPCSQWSLRFSGASSRHSFTDYVEKGVVYNGNEIAGGPRFIANAEVSYKPVFVKNFRISAEWQHIGSYYMDNANTKKYGGYDLLNVRAGYTYRGWEVWINAINVTDTYYSTYASKAGTTISYNLGDPQEFRIGIAYRLSKQPKN